MVTHKKVPGRYTQHIFECNKKVPGRRMTPLNIYFTQNITYYCIQNISIPTKQSHLGDLGLGLLPSDQSPLSDLGSGRLPVTKVLSVT